MTAARKLRVGIISANWGAKSHLPAWRLQRDAEVTAICTSRRETAEAAAAEFGIDRPFWDYEAMCADPDIDIVDCGTSPLQREKMVASALRAGKHVVNQLPFASTVERAAELVALQRSAGSQGIAAASMVGLPHVAYLRELIADGYVGDIFQVQCHWQASYFIPPIPDFPYNWFGKAGLGVGVTRNQGSHLLHLMRDLFGPVRSLLGRPETRLKGWETAPGQWMDNETDDTLHALLAFDSGAMGLLTTSWAAVDSPGFTLDVFGSRGRLTLRALRYPGMSTATLYGARPSPYMQPMGEEMPLPERFLDLDGLHLDPSLATDPIAGEQLPSTARLFHSLLTAIRTGSEPLASFSRSLEVQAMVAALYESHAQRRWIDQPAA